MSLSSEANEGCMNDGAGQPDGYGGRTMKRPNMEDGAACASLYRPRGPMIPFISDFSRGDETMKVPDVTGPNPPEPSVLLIWETTAGYPHLYLIPRANLDDEDMATLRAAHGHHPDSWWQRTEGAAAIERIVNAVGQITNAHKGTRWVKRYAAFGIGDGPLQNVNIVAVFRCW